MTKNLKAVLTVATLASSFQAFAIGENLAGSRTMPGGTQTTACSAAKNAASSAGQTQIDFLQTTGQLRDKKYSLRVAGCQCDKSSSGFMCSADWEIKIERN